jgi:polyphosphate kinase 2 (PPK2 family)
MAQKENRQNEGGLSNKEYTKKLRRLQAELCKLQEWVKYNGIRVIVVFEGRDAAGKGGTIRAMTERVSPRVFRVVALPAPSDREKTQVFMQRYIERFPSRINIALSSSNAPRWKSTSWMLESFSSSTGWKSVLMNRKGDSRHGSLIRCGNGS